MMVLDGQRATDISDRLSLSPKTVSTYRQCIYEKLQVNTDVGLVFRYGLIKDDFRSVWLIRTFGSAAGS